MNSSRFLVDRDICTISENLGRIWVEANVVAWNYKCDINPVQIFSYAPQGRGRS